MLDITFSLISPMLVGFFIGQYFDNKTTATFPVWSVVGFFFGMITGFWSVYKKYVNK